VVKRGEVWWVDFGVLAGSEPGWQRPAVVVSSDLFNRSRIATVLVAPVTSTMQRAEAPGNVAMARGDAGLSKPSVVNVSAVTVVDRSRLLQRAGAVTADVMTDVEDGLRLVLAL
jgi:mRNA interferase MazF